MERKTVLAVVRYAGMFFPFSHYCMLEMIFASTAAFFISSLICVSRNPSKPTALFWESFLVANSISDFVIIIVAVFGLNGRVAGSVPYRV